MKLQIIQSAILVRLKIKIKKVTKKMFHVDLKVKFPKVIFAVFNSKTAQFEGTNVE